MTRQPRELKNMLRFALEQADNSSSVVPEPEKMEWLKNAVKNLSVDIVAVMKSDISQLSTMLANCDFDEESARALMEELLSITEDLDVANDFFKVGGKELLINLIFDGPVMLKECSYQLLANLTQNNPNAQQICLSNNLLQHLLTSLNEEEKFVTIKKNLLSISCLVRHYHPGVVAFCEADGFTVVLERLLRLTDNSTNSSGELLVPVVVKGAFLLLSLVEELPPERFDILKSQHLPDKFANLIMHSPVGAQEYLARSLFLLLSGSSPVADSESEPTEDRRRFPSLSFSPTIAGKWRLWLTNHYRELERQNDASHLELLQELQRLISLNDSSG